MATADLPTNTPRHAASLDWRARSVGWVDDHADLAINLVRVVVSAGLTGVSLVMSYRALHHLAAAHGMPMAGAWPLIIDGLEVLGTLALLRASLRIRAGKTRRRRKADGSWWQVWNWRPDADIAWGWFLVLAASAASAAANAANSPQDRLSMAIHASPALVMAVCMKDLTREAKSHLRHAAGNDNQRAAKPVAGNTAAAKVVAATPAKSPTATAKPAGRGNDNPVATTDRQVAPATTNASSETLPLPLVGDTAVLAKLRAATSRDDQWDIIATPIYRMLRERDGCSPKAPTLVVEVNKWLESASDEVLSAVGGRLLGESNGKRVRQLVEKRHPGLASLHAVANVG